MTPTPNPPPQLAPATDDHLCELMEWFAELEPCRLWGGPEFRWPFTEETFREDAYWGKCPSFALLPAPDSPAPAELLAFGQIYPRQGRCHLARLAVSPARRRSGLGVRLVRALAEAGGRLFDAAECSLFVAERNAPAVGLYRKLGFTEAPFPAGGPKIEDAIFMTAPTERITGSPPPTDLLPSASPAGTG